MQVAGLLRFQNLHEAFGQSGAQITFGTLHRRGCAMFGSVQLGFSVPTGIGLGSSSLDDMAHGALQVGKQELVSAVQESCWCHTCACEQKRVAHFAKH